MCRGTSEDNTIFNGEIFQLVYRRNEKVVTYKGGDGNGTVYSERRVKYPVE